MMNSRMIQIIIYLTIIKIISFSKNNKINKTVITNKKKGFKLI